MDSPCRMGEFAFSVGKEGWRRRRGADAGSMTNTDSWIASLRIDCYIGTGTLHAI